MTPFFSEQLRKNFIGYAVLIFLPVFLTLAHLLSLSVYFLLLFLLTDVCTNDLNRKFPRIPKALLFWSLFVACLLFFAFIAFTVFPLFAKEVPQYFSLIRDDSVQFIQDAASRMGIEIETETIKDLIFSQSSKSLSTAVKILNSISKEIVYVLFAFVLNLLLFLEKGAVARVLKTGDNSLLAYLYDFCSMRLKRFYGYFRKVMVGQFFISLVNTSVTFIVIAVLGLPHKITLVCIVFLCGLLPIIGNLVSNTILSITALVSIGIPAFIVCLGMLVGLHKLEYFLNGKIIGAIIRLPMFITVVSLLLGETLMGFFGMIIAIPMVLTIRDELATIRKGQTTVD